jgi:group I intron endonuclease
MNDVNDTWKILVNFDATDTDDVMNELLTTSHIKRPGIYTIRNTLNNDLYVGSAWNCFERYGDHWKSLKGGYHKNHRLQAVVKEHGIGVLEFRYLRLFNRCDVTRESMFRLEQSHIDSLEPVYNIVRNVKSGHPPHTQATKDKLSKCNAKQWIVTDPTGKEMTITNLFRFCKEHGLLCGSMGAVARGRSSHCHGWKVRRAGESVERYVNGHGHYYEVTAPNGEKTTVKNLARYCRENGLIYMSMTQTANGYQKQHRGYTCRKINPPTS